MTDTERAVLNAAKHLVALRERYRDAVDIVRMREISEALRRLDEAIHELNRGGKR